MASRRRRLLPRYQAAEVRAENRRHRKLSADRDAITRGTAPSVLFSGRFQRIIPLVAGP